MRKGFEQELRGYNGKINTYGDPEKLQEGRLTQDTEALIKKTAMSESEHVQAAA